MILFLQGSRDIAKSYLYHWFLFCRGAKILCCSRANLVQEQLPRSSGEHFPRVSNTNLVFLLICPSLHHCLEYVPKWLTFLALGGKQRRRLQITLRSSSVKHLKHVVVIFEKKIVCHFLKIYRRRLSILFFTQFCL